MPQQPTKKHSLAPQIATAIFGGTLFAACADMIGLHEAHGNPNSCSTAESCAPGFACRYGVCVSEACQQSELQCDGLRPQRCGPDGKWKSETTDCEALCTNGECVLPRSCQGSDGAQCADGSSCCKALFVPDNGANDTFNLHFELPRQDGSAGTIPKTVERTIRPFMLDRFEVTVSRFKAFLNAYDREGQPTPGQGAHPAFPDSGWQATWSESGGPLAGARQSLVDDVRANGIDFTELPGDLPAAGVDWYAAFAFCIWDGGRLPTEAEWAYAASGGNDSREYPWSVDRASANHELTHFSDEPGMLDAPRPVGSFPDGRGRFGHDDLAGNVSEWVADTYADELPRSCNDASAKPLNEHECLNLDEPTRRVNRGGGFRDVVEQLRNTSRTWHHADLGLDFLGFRCAREAGGVTHEK